LWEAPGPNEILDLVMNAAEPIGRPEIFEAAHRIVPPFGPARIRLENALICCNSGLRSPDES
jgi:hypothetical protein